jgi:LytS/YehU family sensor histidine kinase
VDKEWVQAGTRRFAAYTNIPGGNYTFRVKAANNEGAWSDQIAAIQIHISTPWWRTWWFFVLLAGALGGAFWFFYKWRIREFRKQEQLKIQFERKLADVKMNALRAQINPHFIFNCLNSIDYYIIKNESQKASEYLNQFSRLIRLILQNSSANFVPLKDELEALQLYMQMESMRFNHRFDYEVKIEKNLDTENLEIPPMLLQPYVENAIWHGLMPKTEKGAIQVAITRENGYLHCAIEDNGIGREKAELFKASNHSTKKRSMGMAITQNRIELLNQQLGANTTVNIIDLKDEYNKAIGTRVELNIPINE